MHLAGQLFFDYEKQSYMKKKIKALIAYDGTNYCGWQVQPNGVSVQQVVNEALSDLFKEEITTVAASRTDAGVHSVGNMVLFEADTRMPGEKVAYALNQRLPEDIACQGSWDAEEGFHPRYSESYKTYEYRILNRRFPQPTLAGNSHFYHYALDVAAMQKAAEYLVGEHDFTSFASIHAQTNTWVRTVYELEVTRDENDIVMIRITGNGFLYNMVRIIAGTLLQVGAGMRQPSDIPKILEAKDREKAGPTAPAKGLTMAGLHYLTEEELTAKEAGEPWPFVPAKNLEI